MSEKEPTPPDTVLGALPRSRPHRRSDKRGAPAAQAPPKPAASASAKAAPAPRAKPGAAKPGAAPRARAKAPARARTEKPAKPALRQPPQPRGLPPRAPGRKAEREPATRPVPGRRDLIATAVQAAAELTEMGLSAGARALRDAVSRLPRP